MKTGKTVASIALPFTLVWSAAAGAGTASPLTAKAVVQSQVDAFNRHDIAAFASCFADDVELFDLGSEAKPNLSGKIALIARYKPILERYRPRATIVSRIASGDFVIDKERTEAGGRRSEGVAIYQIQNGKIRRVWFTP